jgi:hypothetical protein
MSGSFILTMVTISRRRIAPATGNKTLEWTRLMPVADVRRVRARASAEPYGTCAGRGVNRACLAPHVRVHPIDLEGWVVALGGGGQI